MAQRVHPIDGVGAGDHAGDQRPDFKRRVGAHRCIDVNTFGYKTFQAHPFGQPHGGHQPGVRHEIRIVKVCVGLDGGM